MSNSVLFPTSQSSRGDKGLRPCKGGLNIDSAGLVDFPVYTFVPPNPLHKPKQIVAKCSKYLMVVYIYW